MQFYKMVLFQVAGYQRSQTTFSNSATIFSFGIFQTKEDAINGLHLVCKEPRTPAPYHDINHATYGRKGWCAWINEIADLGEMTQNTLQPCCRKPKIENKKEDN